MIGRDAGYRAFIAIELPRALRARVAEHIDTLRRELPDVRASWTREENLHLTLKFLGDVPVADIAKISSAVEAAAQTFNRFELVVSGCGAFPPHGQPKVLWIGADPGAQGAVPKRAARLAYKTSSLQTLHNALEDSCSAIGFPREPRAFHPHLTIARLRSAKSARRLAELHAQLGFSPQSFTVSQVVVFRSELRSEGAQHTALSQHALK